MFFQHFENGRIFFFFLIIYVDDLIIIGDNLQEIEKLKRKAIEFEVKNLGQLRCCLGMEVSRSKNGINVSHGKYILDLLIDIGMIGCELSNNPIEM